MITNLYIVSHTVWPPPLWMYSMRLLRMLKRSLVLYPPPPPPAEWMPLFNQLVFVFRKCGSWERIQSCIRWPRISQGRSIEDGSEPWRPVNGVWHDQLANCSLPYCRYGGNVLLEEKIVSNSLIDLQDMRAKDFIRIALACKWFSNYYAN